MATQVRFPVGTTYTKRGKANKVCTVEDVHLTYNLAGELVKIRYVTSNLMMDQKVFDYDVVDATIARSLIEMGD